MKTIRYFLLLAGLTLSAAALQAQQIQGKVVDENTQPVAGAIVSVPGTSLGGITDADGNFTLNLPADNRDIQVSFPGYENQTATVAPAQTELSIQLAVTNQELEEVVAVGYGTMKRAHLTGSVATVSPEEIADLSASSLSATLEGLMPGVSVDQSSNRPGEQARISVRGSTSEKDVIYVIDDVISDATAFNNLDPSEIENVSVLKDAAAAVFGMRSANGAVVVRTKRGQVGKPKISYSGQFGLADEFYRSKMLNSYDYGVMWNGVRAADPTQTGFDPLQDLFQADELEAMRNINYDLLDKYWSASTNQKHGVTLSGGSETMTAFGSITYQTQDGSLGDLKYNRWNFRAGMDAKITPYLKASLTVSGNYGENRKAMNVIGGTTSDKDYVMLQSHPTYIPEYVVNPVTGRSYAVAPLGVDNVPLSTNTNFGQYYHFDEIQKSGDFMEDMPMNATINGSLEYDFGWSRILKGLKLRTTYSKSINVNKQNEKGTLLDLYAFGTGTNGRGGSGSHLYQDTPENALDFSSVRLFQGNNGNRLRRRINRSDSYQLNFYANYARTFGLHDVSAMFTIERSESEYEDLYGQRLMPFSFTNNQFNGAGGDMEANFGRSESGSLSYVGRVNYAYNGRYLAELMVRTDASTKFAPENYWGSFPALTLGWIISQESWFQRSLPFVDFLKIRGTFGMLGNDNLNAWQWMMSYTSEPSKGPIFGGNPDLNAGTHFGVPNSIPNRNSRWDKSYQYNAGIDAYFMDNRLSATVDYYYRHNKDTFMPISSAANFPTTVGANASASNFGEDANWGVDLSLGWKDKIGRDASYFVKLNTSFRGDKLIKFPEMNDVMVGLDAKRKNERSDRGRWGYQTLGMFKSYQEIGEYFSENNLTTYLGKTLQDVHPGMLIYKNIRGSQKADGTYFDTTDPTDPAGNLIDKNDMVKVSDRNSNIYGFTLNFGGQWRSLSLNAQLGASWGSYNFMPAAALTPKDGGTGSTNWNTMQYINMPSFWANDMFVYQDVLDAQGRVVAPQNLNAKYPNMRFSDNFQNSDFWKINQANVFLRNVTIAYTVPKEWVNKIGIESCRINLTGQNLLEFYNPYPDKFMSPNSSYGVYPLMRRFTLGLNITL